METLLIFVVGFGLIFGLPAFWMIVEDRIANRRRVQERWCWRLMKPTGDEATDKINGQIFKLIRLRRSDV